jgi:hypothetical protein
MSIVRSIKPKLALGDPRDFLREAARNGEESAVLGWIVGKATGLHTHKRTEPSGEVRSWPALKGDFEAIPVDDSWEIQRAPIAFLPDHIHQMIATLFEGDDPRKQVEFAFQVGARADKKSPAGFVWTYTPMAEPQAAESDPLSHLRALVNGGSQRALEAPEEASDEVEQEGETNGRRRRR